MVLKENFSCIVYKIINISAMGIMRKECKREHKNKKTEIFEPFNAREQIRTTHVYDARKANSWKKTNIMIKKSA